MGGWSGIVLLHLGVWLENWGPGKKRGPKIRTDPEKKMQILAGGKILDEEEDPGDERTMWRWMLGDTNPSIQIHYGLISPSVLKFMSFHLKKSQTEDDHTDMFLNYSFFKKIKIRSHWLSLPSLLENKFVSVRNDAWLAYDGYSLSCRIWYSDLSTMNRPSCFTKFIVDNVAPSTNIIFDLLVLLSVIKSAHKKSDYKNKCLKIL